MRRRELLHGLVSSAVLFAGCGSVGNTDRVTIYLLLLRATPENIASVFTVSPSDEIETEVGSETLTWDQLARRIVSRESFTVTDTNPGAKVDNPGPFFEEPVFYNGSVYDFRVNAEEVTTNQIYDVTVYYNLDDSADPSSNLGVRYETLPPIDKRALDDVFPVPNATRKELQEDNITPGIAGNTSQTVSRELTVRYNESEKARSRLVDGDYIRYRNRTYPVRIRHRTQQVTRKKRYGYAERWSPSAFADRIRSRHGFDLDGLTDEQQSIIEEAISSGALKIKVGESDTTRDAANALRETLEEQGEQLPLEKSDLNREDLRPPFRGYRDSSWLVRYEGTFYLLFYFENTSEHI